MTGVAYIRAGGRVCAVRLDEVGRLDGCTEDVACSRPTLSSNLLDIDKGWTEFITNSCPFPDRNLIHTDPWTVLLAITRNPNI